ncbi:hypothetical protein [uncultured Mitsuokella sp.]|uniref:hypothetical protein n=1 Tax=uncultured Mitsuokella sp. TaxID=453120 RepID=UPI0026DB0ACB|nr:hypothetical protein [uncultured Mitsuokella sp.]
MRIFSPTAGNDVRQLQRTAGHTELVAAYHISVRGSSILVPTVITTSSKSRIQSRRAGNDKYIIRHIAAGASYIASRYVRGRVGDRFSNRAIFNGYRISCRIAASLFNIAACNLTSRRAACQGNEVIIGIALIAHSLAAVNRLRFTIVLYGDFIRRSIALIGSTAGYNGFIRRAVNNYPVIFRYSSTAARDIITDGSPRNGHGISGCLLLTALISINILPAILFADFLLRSRCIVAIGNDRLCIIYYHNIPRRIL